MAAIQRIDDERAAAALADLLNGSARKRPVVVVTIPGGRTDPWIDVEHVAHEAGDLAEVYLMPTGAFTWEFSRRMPPGTQVYGGAGRVYPVGHAWLTDTATSPLRFAFDAQDGNRATDLLVSDTLSMAAAGGLLRPSSTRALRPVSGLVKMVVAGRALVDVGNVLPAALAEELTAQGVPIDRIVTVGQRVKGEYDAETNRIDVTRNLRSASDALACYAVGDVVLTKVVEVRPSEAGLALYPQTTAPAVTVTVGRADVTANPFDDLSDLMTVGEVVPARIVAAGPTWALVLHDLDDDEPVVDAPALLEGGPPWLVEERGELEVEEQPPLAPPSLPMPAAVPTQPTPDEALVVEQQVVEAVAPPGPRPTPALLDRRRPRPARPAAVAPRSTVAPAESTKALLLRIDGLNADLGRLNREQQSLRAQLVAACDEREQLRYLLEQAERRANRAENDLKAARARLRKAGSTKATADPPAPRFADPEQGFRYLVLTRWATRTLPGEQPHRPLPDYLVGPRFLESLDQLDGIKPEKVADVVFEIVTGLAPQLPGREVHHLRSGHGGDDPVRVREDGAVAWRASLQVRTPSARRIHYWVCPDGRIELARVATHDDVEI